MIVAELEALFKGDLSQFDKDAKTFEATTKRLTSTPITAKVDADVRTALSDVEKLGDKVRRTSESVEVEADTSKAEDAIEGLGDTAEGAGADGGKRGGDALAAGIVGALATIPIAGAVVGIADTVAKSVVEGFQAGLAVEVRADRLAATTNLGPAAVGRLARASGEAYADNFGESIEQNMATARNAVQSGLLDPKATQRDAQQIIADIEGVADLVEEDAARVSRSTAQLLRTGVASTAQEAFDIIVAGQQAGLNVSEDWLDTLDEYGTQFRKLGLDGAETLGLLRQGVQGGARDTDIVADSLKELSIRAIDGSTTTVEGFRAIGLSAEDMAAKFADGGESARDALDATLDGLRAIEDPVKRDAAAVALFGTQAEDLGEALLAMDLDSAAKGFEDLEGRASRALATLGDNSAGELAKAQRGIDVAVESIQGALAGAFGDEITAAGEFVSENREEVTRFLLDTANAAIDVGRAFVESAAAGTEAFGDFTAETIPGILEGIDDVVQGMARIGLISYEQAHDFAVFKNNAVDNLKDFDRSTEATAETIRANLIEGALDPAQDKLNEFGKEALSDARLSDATNKLADDIADVGYAADGSKTSLAQLDGTIDTTTESGKRLDGQIRAVRDGLLDQVGAAAAAGESNESLADRARDARTAFIDQVTAMGATRAEAEKLADDYGLIPRQITTTVTADTSQAYAALEAFRQAARDNVVRTGGLNHGGLAAGGRLPGFPMGGRLPGIPPADRTRDNLLGVDGAGIPRVRVRSREWVVNQQASDYYGDALMGALNAQAIPREALRGLTGLASGGAVGVAARDIERARRELEGARAGARRARQAERAAQRTETERDDAQAERAEAAAQRRLDRAERRLDEARDRHDRLRAERSELTTDLRRGDIRDSVTGGLDSALSVTDRLRDLAGSGDVTSGQASRLRRTAAGGERALERLYREASRAERQLVRTRERLEELQQIRSEVRGNLTGGFSLADVPGGTDPWTGEDKSPTGQQLKKAAEAYRARVQKYAGLTKRLAKVAGPGILTEFRRYGIDQGIPIAEALLTLPAGHLRSLAGTYEDIARFSDYAGVNIANGIDGRGGFTDAKRDVERAEADAEAIDKRIGKWSKTFARELARTLGIKPRANGGPAYAGGAYLVGEEGPELHVPEQSGYVLDANRTRNLNSPQKVVNVYVTQNYPQAIPASKAINRALAHAAEEA